MTWRMLAMGGVFVAAIGCLAGALAAPDDAKGVRTQDFTSDPQWQGYRNRLLPKEPRITRQDFGFRTSNKSGGKEPGEIGGWVQRSLTPAYYAKPIADKSLNDRLSMSGRFSVHFDESNTGTMIGWFNSDSRGWRTPNSLVVRLDGNGGKYWVFVEYGTRGWLTACKGCFEGEAYQTTKTKPFLADRTPHTFSLTYDPDASDGNGLVTFVLNDQTYTLPLVPGHKQDGAAFNRFGVFNQQTSGGGMECYIDDLVLDGQPVDFSSDPKWEGQGNKVQFQDRGIRPLHDFGFSETAYAGGKGKGELGGILWRDEAGTGWYADAVGPLTLDDELFASGRIAFTGAGSDSAGHVGWFNSASRNDPPLKKGVDTKRTNELSIMLEGPSRIGHYFRPAYQLATGEGAGADDGPILRPDGKPHEWTIRYSPKAANGNGRVTVTLDREEKSLDLKPGQKAAGGTFDRFGLFSPRQHGGTFVQVYLDDLTYTAKSAAARP